MNRLLIFGLIIVFNVSCSSYKYSDEVLQAKKELTLKLSEISSQSDFNGFGLALANENEVLYQNGFGISNIETHQKYDENTVQNIASVSKTFIGISLLKAQEQGKLNLDDPVNKYLTFKVVNPYHSEIPITIRHLATHTSSINDTEQYLTRTIVLKDTTNLVHNFAIDISPTKFNPPSAKMGIEEFLKNMLYEKGKWYNQDIFLDKKPGELYNYSNVGATLAALVLEKATGVSYDAFTTKYILKPLKMNNSGWNFSSIDFSKYTNTFQNKTVAYPYYSLITYPDGGLLTTSADMGKFICELLKGYSGRGTLLSKESYKEYFRQQLTAENFTDRATSEYSDEYNMGITIGFGSTGNFGHYGGDPGLFSMIYFDKETKTGRYFITNTDGNGETTAKYQKQIMDLLNEYTLKLNELSKKN